METNQLPDQPFIKTGNSRNAVILLILVILGIVFISSCTTTKNNTAQVSYPDHDVRTRRTPDVGVPPSKP
jgi:hypothetical protein